jgi:D-alanyl-D-alanine carboxypeptidase/D-alanyl-D-alanine-endopeptidase (penicillin-binding protein 4)
MPDGALQPLADIQSPPLAEIIRDINKHSNNVMARQLFLTLGTPVQESDATHPRRSASIVATARLRAWLKQKQLDFPELELENGAGLSRQERISATSLARLLNMAWESPLMPEFIASLPIVGIDGTMKKRLAQTPVAGRAHIKTGTLDGVKTMAGYVLDHRGRWQMVVFLANHPNAAATQATQDALLKWVYQH